MSRTPMSRTPSGQTTDETGALPGAASGSAPRVLALVVAWAAGEPQRAGEVALLPARSASYVLGRGAGDPSSRLVFARQRPGELLPTAPLESRAISRDQIEIVAEPARLRVRRIGRCRMAVNGLGMDEGTLAPGDTLRLEGQLVCLCVSRPAMMPRGRYLAAPSWGPFGEADGTGIVGESEAAWRLRDDLGFAGAASAHALLTGETGTGKELAARAVHALSPRTARRFVSRNAATFPSTLVDAELFGNAKNYPNPGSPERQGLVGEADLGTLFLDEIGELALDLQAHLLRVLDARGEYQRLGDATVRRADLRLVCATNRAPESLKPDLLARLAVRVDLPPLDARREDLPLLVRQVALDLARTSPKIAERFVGCSPGGRLEVRVRPELVEGALRRRHPTNVRGLEAMLWQAMRESPGDVVECPQGFGPDEASDTRPPEPTGPTADEVRASVREADGNLSEAARALGLPSRYALYRLIKKHGIDVGALREEEGR